MTKTELRHFETLLRNSATELEQPIRQRDSIKIHKTPDELEEIQQASELALALCNLDREFHQLRNTRAAIRRIQDGSYGKCCQCGEDVHLNRLAAVPSTLFCLRCQEAFYRNPKEIRMPSSDLLSSESLKHIAGGAV
jgi:DnaK suppressor protein